ncbi:iron ABC transporter permease [Schaalia hyovaginalis]|uniref:ABC transporter permease n=1 Tax=Schaalia hyovaginalis TaxID=29316 RepID=UPI0026F1F4CF|nr:iron ABC transporter permease [Schaalia hyovaginalis]MCI6557614.1 iron ABC transporter permease [Schaalia hyovaginalis]MDD7553315.1 iron ABC transporter permease [Schaalia hyovaginalis]MDY2668900.1 iron ABC transporter permease [Schaalia hyovaginalis]MDY3093039.1 iron ABC transporter permease [Schaalia hyovaginalis]MDY6213864.1 iron ABC transporter permease [Schaalia hyovaginalis]
MSAPAAPRLEDSLGGTRTTRRSTRVRRDPTTIALVAVVFAVLFLLVLLPLITILSKAFSSDGLSVLTSVFASSTNRTIILNTVILGVVVGLAGTLIGFFLAFIQARVALPGKKILHLIALIPIVSPPFAVATSSITLFGRNGIISTQVLGQQWNIYGLPGLTLVLTLSFFPVAYMNMLGMLRNLDPAMEEAAASLGASQWKVFRSVTLPMLIPGFAASFLLLFVEAIADLANPLVIGGDFTVLASRAYIAINGEYNTAAGSAYSLILLVPALLVFLIQRYWAGRSSAVTVTGKPAGRVRLVRAPLARIPLGAATALVALFIVTIYATVIVGAFVNILGVDNTPTLNNFRYVLSGIGNDAMIDTTILALIATPIAGLLGMVVAWLVVVRLKASAGVMDFLGMLGLSVPGTVLGIGYLITYNQPIIFAGRQYMPALAGGSAVFGGALAIILVYVARSMPSGQRSGIASLQQIDKSIDEASTSLGASGLQTFARVTMPLIRPAFIAGLTYAFARSMTTLSPIIFITTPRTKIMTSQILSEVDAGRFGNAFAFCTILILIVMAVIGLTNILVRDNAPAAQNRAGL